MSWLRRILGIGALGAAAVAVSANRPSGTVELRTPIVAQINNLGPQGVALSQAAASKFNQEFADAKAAADSGDYQVALGHVEASESWADKFSSDVDKHIASSRINISKKNLKIMRDTRTTLLDLNNKIAEASGELGANSREIAGPEAVKKVQKIIQAQDNADFQLVASYFGIAGVRNELVRSIAILEGIANDPSRQSHNEAKSLAFTLGNLLEQLK